MEGMETARAFTNTSDFISQRAFDEHIKLYNGYVGKVNEITSTLASFPDRGAANATYSVYRGLKEGETYALDGVILHELYFPLLGNKQTQPGAKTQEIFNNAFGGYDNWKTDFVACGTSARGWAILVYEQRTGTYRNILLDLHNEGLVCGAYPLLVMDCYEHAYFMDYGSDKGSYISKFIASLPWGMVEKRAVHLNK